MVVLGLLLASGCWAIGDLPSAALENTSRDRAARELVETVSQRLHDQILTPATAMESAAFSRGAFEHPRPPNALLSWYLSRAH